MEAEHICRARSGWYVIILAIESDLRDKVVSGSLWPAIAITRSEESVEQ